MSKLKRVMIDVDGVLADFGAAFRAVMNEVHGLNLTKDPTTWGWSDLGVTSEQVNVAWKKWGTLSNHWLSLQPMDDGIVLADAIQEGKLDGFEIWFVTSRAASAGESALKQTRDWLFWYVGVEPANVIVVKHSTFKADVVRALDISYSIDDYAPTIVALNHQPGHKSLLMRRPWNDHDRVAYELPSVGDMTEFIKLLRGEA